MDETMDIHNCFYTHMAYLCSFEQTEYCRACLLNQPEYCDCETPIRGTAVYWQLRRSSSYKTGFTLRKLVKYNQINRNVEESLYNLYDLDLVEEISLVEEEPDIKEKYKKYKKTLAGLKFGWIPYSERYNEDISRLQKMISIICSK